MIRKTIALCALLFAGAVSAQTKISGLTALAAAPASGDLVAIVDVSDTTQAATGTTKKITASNLFLFRFPASSTDNAISRYDGTSGTLQDSGITVADVTGSSVTVATTAGNSLVVETTEPAATTGASVAGTTTALRAGDAVASTDTAGAAAGGAVAVTAGNAARLTSGNANGGDVTLTGGAGIGTGTAGQVVIAQSGDVTPGTAASPALRFGTAQNGLYSTSSGLGLSVAANGTDVVEFLSNGVEWGGSAFPHYGLARTVTALTGGSGAPTSLGTANNLWRYLTNEGAGATAYNNLPSAAANYEFSFIVQSTNGMRIVAATGDTIRIMDKVTAAGGYIESTSQGSTITLVSINATEWYAVAVNGVWTDGTFTFDNTSLTTP